MGDALRADNRQADGRFRGAPGRVRRVDSVRGRRCGPASVIGGWWRTSAEVPALAFSGVPGDSNILLQSTLQNAIVIRDLSGPAGGIMLKSPVGATIVVK